MKVNILIIGQNKPDENNKGFFLVTEYINQRNIGKKILVTEYLNQRKIEETINRTIVVTSIEEGVTI